MHKQYAKQGARHYPILHIYTYNKLNRADFIFVSKIRSSLLFTNLTKQETAPSPSANRAKINE